jgi:protein phosphatase
LSGAALVAHVGDSRAYLWRDGVLEQITRDHSWVEEQIASGALSEEEARAHPWRNLVTRALAGAEPPNVDITPVALERGDRVLICSDGLTSPLTDQAIQEMMNRVPRGQAETLCQSLVDAANAAGGPDNITVIVVEVS